MLNTVKLRNFEIGGKKLTVFAGPCAIESKDILFKTAQFLKKLTSELDINFVFKSSFDKANRSSIHSYRGLGIETGLSLLADVKKEFDIPIVTDIHETNQASLAAEVADVIQIPAFLCRQTDLLVAAAKTNKIINIKKGQFLAPSQMNSIANKVKESGNNKITITDRGVTFGYNNLVSDMRAVPIIQEMGYPVIFDATHSVQLPGGCGNCSSGERKFVSVLARAAIASGADGLFFEVHPNPDYALCDGANMINFEQAKNIFKICRDIFNLIKNN
ncbi:MAG: 3-deoxy-8-phosphooctulonate synthase [Candidatus Gastranaerophilales bacterium]|nr:3-deoxy-8-phosphooctulonate synthase [Candidatus Gastranaerophilales bacterium]